MLGTMFRWCITAFSSGLWNIPTSVDQVRDGRLVQMHVKIDAFCEQRGKKSVTCCSSVLPRTIGNCLLAAGLRSRVPLARLPLTPGHHQAQLLWRRERVDWRVEWRSVVFSDESRFCLYASEGRTRVRRRPCERPQRTGPPSGFMM